MIVLMGKKIGMTQILNSNNVFIPVTIIKFSNNIITSIKKSSNKKKVQITTGKVNFKKLNNCKKNFFKKINVKPGLYLYEVPYIKNLHTKIGKNLDVSIFNNINKVNVTGISKGKGFSGTVKRWNFKTQDKSHGNSLSHRVPGSIGQNQSPGKVFKGKKMSGHLGNSKVTKKNLDIINIYLEKNLLIIKGCVSGFNNSYIIVKSSVK